MFVRDGKASRMSKISGASYDVEQRTIDGVFHDLEWDFRHADHVEADYDATWGFPSHVSIDEEKSAIDDEHGYGVEAFWAPS